MRMVDTQEIPVVSAAPVTRPRLLLAEDEPVQQLKFRRILVEQGYEVETVSSGEDALHRVLEGGVDILLTDWDMPGLDGAQLCRRVREARLAEYLYILMITGHSSDDDAVFALNAGANDYIRKPFNNAELLARLRSASELVGAQRGLRIANESLSAANAKLTAAAAEKERMMRVECQLRCYNKRYLNEQLPRAITHAVRYHGPLSLVMADLDFFKRINDTHGHNVGDEVLSGFVDRAVASLRSGDWMARFGGEEFAIVLPETSLEGARSVAEKVRANCAASPVDTSRGLVEVTVSLGVAAFQLPDDSRLATLVDTDSIVNDLVSRADQALYRSKREGRNRVSLSPGGRSE
jgi:two-component system, cell cycle response regulator